MKSLKLFIPVLIATLVALPLSIYAAESSEATPNVEKNNQFFLGVGTASLNNLEANDLSYNFYGGKLWELTRMIAIKALYQATTDFDQSVLTSGNLGANFYPIKSKYSPYIGGTVGVGYGREHTFQDNFGFDVSANFGLQLFRSRNTQVSLETQANYLLRDASDGSKPADYAARVGILF